MSKHSVLLVLGIVLGVFATLAGCVSPTSPTPTPTEEAAQPTETAVPPSATRAPLTDTPAPTATSEPPTPTPTPTAEAERLALYVAGPIEARPLFALDASGEMTDLGVTAYDPTAVSRDGRWIATTDQPAPATEVHVTDLQTDSTMTFPVTSDFDVFGLAFDRNAARLGYVEVGSPGENGTPWAVVVADLENGTVTRFDAVFRGEEGVKPGYPIGWDGDELLLDTFIPYTEAGSLGVWAITLPPGGTSTPIDALNPEEIVAGDDYLLAMRLSPGRDRLLYLNRDYDYTPDNYGTVAYDLAVNQLWWMDMETENADLLIAETEGGALGRQIAWSPDGNTALYAEGRYSEDTFDFLTLKTVPIGEEAPSPTEVAPVPLPLNGYLTDLAWCTSEMGLVVVATEDGAHQLHTLDTAGGTTDRLTDADSIQVLGCIHATEEAMMAATADADVLTVRAVEADDGTWSFEVTVEHPDTGWDDYANGWDVVTPEGEVLKPNPDDAFTRVLLHPHENEQPFTRSQRGIVIPEGVTQVRVRAHDIVDGFGGREVVVDLSQASGEDYEVIRGE